MLPQDSLQQELIESIRKSLTFDILYQRIRPDISKFITATTNLSLKGLDGWERLIRAEMSYSLRQYNQKQSDNDFQQVGSLRW